MTQLLSRGVVRVFRLTDEPGGLGLSCAPSGVSLAGVPLLRRTRTGFAPRPDSEIASLLRAAYGKDPTRLLSRLGAIAQALNGGDFAKAMIAAVHTRTPELSPEAALRLAKADTVLGKYNYNPDEPRDWHGRWTTDGSDGQLSTASPRIDRDQPVDAHISDQRQRIADNTSIAGATTLSDADDGAGEPTSLKHTFEQKYDDLGPTEFAKQVIQFGDWLGRAGGNLSANERERVLAEYSFLQDRLSFWLNYDYKPVTAQGNLLSAALTLYQGAVNGGIVRVGHLPESMLAAAGTASLFGGGPPQRVGFSTTKPVFDEGPTAAGQAPKALNPEDAPPKAPLEIEGLGNIVDNSETEIEWDKGIKDQNGAWEDYYGKVNIDARRLRPGAKGFDHFKDATGEAVSNKTLNTLSFTYVKNPQQIYRKVTGYVDDAVNYERRTESELDSKDILSKTIQLAIPEYTSPTQWRYLLRAIIYGKDNGVSIVITRIRDEADKGFALPAMRGHSPD